MAVIDIPQLIIDAKLYLPEENIVDDATMTSLAESIIPNLLDAKIDDDIYYSEALCKLLRVVANVNYAKSLVKDKGLKRERIDKEEYEYYESRGNVWKDYVNNLPNICPYLPGGGYTGLRNVIGIKINLSEKIKFPEECITEVINEFHLR